MKKWREAHAGRKSCSQVARMGAVVSWGGWQSGIKAMAAKRRKSRKNFQGNLATNFTNWHELEKQILSDAFIRDNS